MTPDRSFPALAGVANLLALVCLCVAAFLWSTPLGFLTVALSLWYVGYMLGQPSAGRREHP